MSSWIKIKKKKLRKLVRKLLKKELARYGVTEAVASHEVGAISESTSKKKAGKKNKKARKSSKKKCCDSYKKGKRCSDCPN